MQRNLILLLGVLVLLLGAALAFVLVRGPSRPAPIAMNAAEENFADPLHQEMDCIDRLIQRNDLDANQVDASLAGCRGVPVGNQSAGE